jgi:hypothetical protein
MFPSLPSLATRAVGLTRFVVLPLLLAGLPLPLEAQDGDWRVLPAGRMRVGMAGVFIHADHTFGQDGQRVPLGSDLTRSDPVELFPGTPLLVESLRDILGSQDYAPVLGTSRSYLQTSQVVVPFTAELGVTSWLTVGATVPLVKSRVEGSVSLLPDADADLGVNPAFTRLTEVQAFVDQVSAAAAGLPAGVADPWIAWANRWTDAYRASAVFPVAGSAAGEALAASVSAFNAALTAAGLTPVQVAIPLADEVLTNEALRLLLSDPAAHFQFLPLPTPLLWGLGDVRLNARLRLLEGPALPSTGRPAYGITALGSVRLPTGSGDEPLALFDLPQGDGHLGYSGGVALWFRQARVGVAAMARYETLLPAEVERRVGSRDLPLIPIVNTRVVERRPGDVLKVEARPSLGVGEALWIEASYRYYRRGADRYEAVGPLPGPPLELGPYPTGELYEAPSVLNADTNTTLQEVGGGLRYHPPEGAFPVEVWARVQVALSGSGDEALRRTRLEFGGRVTRSLWGS